MRGEIILKPVEQDQPVMIDSIDSPYAQVPSLKEMIYSRGLAVESNATRSTKAGGGK